MRQRDVRLMRWMISGYALVAVFIIGSSSCIYAGEGEPRALVEQNEYTFPAVVEGVDVVHEFVLKNAGTAPLDIIRLKAG